MVAPGPAAAGRDRTAVVVLILGIAAVSTAATLIRLADAPALTVAAWRMLFATALLAPFALRTLPRDLPALEPADMRRMALAGVCLALHFALWIASLDYTSVASSVVLVTTSPLWVGLAAPLVLGEPVPRPVGTGIVVAFVGAVMIGGGDLAITPRALLGDLLAMGGAVAAAAYFLIGRGVRPRVGLLTYVTLVYGTAAATLAIVALASGAPMSGLPAATWIALALLGAVPQVLGHSSFNWALGRLSATFVAGTVLGEAVGSTLLAWLVLGETAPASALAGGTVVLAGLLLAVRGESALRAAARRTRAGRHPAGPPERSGRRTPPS